MKKVYVAGALNAMAIEYNNNRKRMMQYALKLMEMGFSVFVPCLMEQIAMLSERDFTYKDYFDNSQPWLECADYLFVVPGWEKSKGTKREIATAKRLGIFIFYDLEQLKAFDHEG